VGAKLFKKLSQLIGETVNKSNFRAFLFRQTVVTQSREGESENTVTTTNRVYRGGSWTSNPGYCRSAASSSKISFTLASANGFRIVCI
jgi:formylglycine-generating enzyme required for sulfatase activity